jgi:transposase
MQWKRKYLAEGDKAFVGKGRAKPDDIKLRRLRRELRRVKEERDILKKALASFSRQKR